MENDKSIISTLLVLFIIFSAIGLAFAAGGTGSGGGGGTGGGGGSGNNTTNGTASAKISVAFDKETAKVGDTVKITVTITNDGTLNLTNIMVLAPLPDGLQYLSHATNTSKVDYTSEDGIWNVCNLKTTSKLNGVKYLYITAKVMSSAENKDLITTAKYLSVEPELPDPNFKKPGLASSNVLKIEKTSTGTGNGTGNGNSSTSKKATLAQAIKNATSTGGIDALQNLDQPAQGGAYEVTNATAPNSSDNSRTAYAVLGGLIIASIIGIGYFKGIKG
jgi:uncharacterized repeat protein (TIGR01451 family)